MIPLRRVLLLCVILLPARASAQAVYDSASAVSYFNAWWNSDIDDDGFVDHVNNSSEAAQNFPPPLGPVGPVPDKNYLWYNNVGGNRGDNGKTPSTGDETKHPNDCTNFVSQALISGGIPIPNLRALRPDFAFGAGNTLLAVKDLDAALKSIAQRQVFTLSASGPSPVPTNLVRGDIIEWGEPHMTMVVSGSGGNVLLGYHSNDNINVPLVNGSTGIYDLFKAAHVDYCKAHSAAGTDCSFSNYTIQGIAYHITGTNIQASLDATPPTFIVQDSNRQTIPDGGATAAGTVSVQVADSDSGVEALEVTVGGTILDSLAPILQGTADLIFMDHASYGPGTHTYSVDLSAVPNGSQVFVEVLDAAGNLAPIQSFQKKPPAAPTVSIPDVFGSPRQGAIAQIPTVTRRSALVDITDETGITAVTLPGPPAVVKVTSPLDMPLTNIPSGTKNISISLTNLSTGTQSFSVANAAAKVTHGSWIVVALGLDVADTSIATYDPLRGFSSKTQLNVSATGGAEQVVTYNSNTQDKIQPYDLASFSIDKSPDSNVSDSFFLRDHAGNAVTQDLTVAPGAISGEMMSTQGDPAPPVTISMSDKTGVFNVDQSGFLKPGIIHVGSAQFSAFALTANAAAEGELTGPVPIVSVQNYGTYSYSAGGQVLVSGTLSSQGDARVQPEQVIEVPDQITFALSLQRAPFAGVSRSNCMDLTPDPNVCNRPLNIVPQVTAHPAVAAVAYTLRAPEYSAIKVFPGVGQTISIGDGVALSEFNVISTGTIVKGRRIAAPAEPEYVNLMGSDRFELETGGGNFYEPNFKLTLPYDSTNHTSGKVVQLARVDDCMPELRDAIPSPGGMAAPVAAFGKYTVVESAFAAPNPKGEGACHFMSDDPSATVNQLADVSSLDQALNVFGSLGLSPIGEDCKMGPTGATFSEPGVVRICLDPAAIASAGGSPLTLYQFNKDGVREELSNLFVDRTRGVLAGTVDHFSSEFSVFASSQPIAALDLLPPITTALLDGAAQPASASYVMTTTSTLSLQATDPAFPGAPVSGVGETLVLLDLPFMDTVTTPGTPYGGPYTLIEGDHALTFYSKDLAGNVETPHVVHVLAIPPPAVTGSRAIALGADSRFWTVTREGEAAAIARTDINGVAIASASLPQALASAQWSVLFDAAGAAYAVGTSSSAAGTDLAAYKATPAGDGLASSQILDGGRGSNDLVLGAGGSWIAGAVQVSGPASLEAQGARVFTAALWRFNPADGTVALSTTFANGAALGVAEDADGSAWVAGFEENDAPRSARTYDLVLRHYAADGTTLLAGPFRREAYASDVSPASAARLLVTSAAVVVAVPRGRTGGGTDLGVVTFDKATGAVGAENAWRAADGSSAYPAALLADGAGTVAAGGLDNGTSRAALWRYGADGAFAAAALAGGGGARGAAARGAELWLAVDDATAAHQVTAETALSGALADVLPPRAELVVSTPSFNSAGGTVFVASTSLLSFSAVDDALAADDGLGAGPTAFHYRLVSTAPFAAFASPFRLEGEGTVALEFYGVDAAGNSGPILSRAVSMDAAAPVTQLSQNGATITLAASDQDGAGVARIRYLVDYADPGVCDVVTLDTSAARGSCGNPWYDGPFTLTGGAHTVAFQAFDVVDNAEALQTANPFVDTSGSGSSSSGGMGIGKDPFDALWSVASEAGALSIAKSSSTGGLLGAAPLQDASEGFPWSVLFDPAGRAYAIGDAAGAGTQGLDLAVYKASADGASIESRILLDSGFANNDIVFDAKAPGWITGAAQTSGPVDLNAGGESTYSMALWRFDPAQGTIQLKATFARAGFDLGAGLAVDPDGSVWIAGYSLTAEAPVVGGFDLALWHYAADGTTLLGGPFLIPGYLDNLDGGLTARVYADGQAVYVTAPRSNAAGGTDTAFLRFDKAAGRVTAESVWRAADGSPSYPIAVLPEAGGLLVAGGIGGEFTEAALWRFGFDGAPRGAATADAGGATGAVFRGADLWLTVEGSTSPYRVQAEVPATGAFVDISTPAAPLTALVVTPSTASVAAGLTIQFAAAGTFADGSTRTMTGEVSWATDLSTVVAVSTTGLMMGLREGEALVIASSGTITAHAVLTVTPPLLVSLAVMPSTATVAAGLTAQFSAAGTFTDGSTRTMTGEVSWSTDLVTVATASSSGLITTFLEGTALVTASSGAVAAQAVLTVTPPVLASIVVSPPAASIPAGLTLQFAAAGAFTDGSTRTVTGEVDWYSYASTVARVDSVGLSTAAAEGVALITAASGPVVGGAVLTVLPPAVVSITVTPAAATIVGGTSLQFNAGGAFTDGSTRAITGEVFWSTDVSSVAEVGFSGVATGVGAGSARIIASRDAVSGAARLTVTAPPLALASISPASARSGESVPAALTGMGFDAATALTLERAEPLRGTWAATGSFAQARYLATLTRLRDGRILMAGGSSAGGSSGTSLSDFFDPATGVWTAGPPMIEPRDQHSAVLLPDGRVLVAGGYRAGSPINSAEIFDPVLNAWTAAAPMSSVRSWYQLVVLPNGRVLAAGGLTASGYLSGVEIYDPKTNSWSAAAPLAQGHGGAATAKLLDGKVLVAGGFGAVLAAEVYNPVTNAWTAAGSLHSSNYFLQAVTRADGKVMIAGDPSGTTDMYDPATNAMTQAASLVTARYVHAMVRVSGTAMVIGGENSTALASTEFYDVAAGAWRPGPALAAPRTWPRAAALDDGRVLVTGGLGSVGGARLNTAELLGTPAAVIAASGEAASGWSRLTGTLNLAGAATGYWDVVVRRTDLQSERLEAGFQVLLPPPALASIAVTPSTASIIPGATAQFAAAGTYADGSTRTITSEISWTTDYSTIALVSPLGLATGVGGGMSRVIASSGAFSAYAALSVAFVTTSTTSVNGAPEVTLVSTAPFSVVEASTDTGLGAVALGSAAAQGLILVSPVYHVTREDQGATAVLTWSFDPALVDTTTLAIWRFDGVAWSSATVLNQVVSVSNGAGTVTGEVVLTSLFALFSRDTAAPITTMLVDGLPAGTTSLSVVVESSLGFSAVDVGVGVRETRFTLDGGVETVFVATFSLIPGTHLLSYRSVDRGGNQEAPKAAEIVVTNPNADTVPPLARLDFPAPSAEGVEQAVGGVVNIRGAASDLNSVTWTLEAAVGAGAAAGFTRVAAGVGSVSGPLASWNTSLLSGYQTLRLTATDASGNISQSIATVFAGKPVITFAAGRKDSDAIVATLKGPAGIAVRDDGAAWVTSVENDQVLLISPMGVLLGAAGSAPGQSGGDTPHGKKDRAIQEAPSFKAPQGLALDAAGNLYVADRDTNRVVKLSPDGQTLLLEFGRSGPGELKRPFDVAVDAGGDVYAADSGNRRVAVFDASGAFLRELGAGVFLPTSEIRGLALTTAGLWVSDKELDVIHLFSREGALLKTIGAADSAVGELSRTRGLAADRLGALYVVEPNRDRVQKFDPQGKGMLAFGNREGLSQADKLARRWLTQPIDAAVGPDGSLWVADAGRDRIVRCALPAAGGFDVAALSARGGVSSSSAEPARRVVDHADGAAVTRDDGSGVRIPKGALAADLEITVEKGDENRDKQQKDAKRRELKVAAVSEEVQYGPEGTTFSAPVSLSLPYDANLIASLGMSEDDLKVYYWNPGFKEWQAMPSTVDKKTKTVNALTNHFSAYQVQGPSAGIGVAAAVDEFGLRDQYAFPSPSRGGVPVTFRIQPGLADSVSVRVYDLSGRKVHSSSDFRFLGAFDDGNGKGAQNTYDHDWSVDGVGSGVYRYVIEAKRAGRTPIVKSGKAGVIK